MKYILVINIGLFLLFSQTTATPADLYGGINIGHYGGLGFDVNGSAHNFASGLPLGLRMNLGYVAFDPGNATDARRIFINNDQGGTVQEKGSLIRLSFDFVYPVKLFNLSRSSIYAGPRYGRFKGNFKFVGDNEDFDVTSNHWGLGAGIEAGFPMSSRMNFIVTTGVDYYFASTLYGHDTSYGPNGESANPRDDYQYVDADQAVNQPKFEFRLMLGLQYRFGK
jgi:hypothetical protein